MIKRTSIVNYTKVNSVGLGSVLQIGDSVQIKPLTRALAIQRQVQLFYGNEGDFEAFPIFTMEIPKFDTVENIIVKRHNPTSFIKVNQIKVTSVSSASVYHIGSSTNIDAESRIKHIRQLERGYKEQ